MIGGTWNCRGLGNPRAVRAIKELIKVERPAFLFLIETKLTVAEWGRMKGRIGARNIFPMGCEGRRGGLALMWEDSVNLSIKSYSNDHIDAWIISKEGFQWRLTGFYGHWDSSKRWESWRKLIFLIRQWDMPCLVGGDFNKILSQNEKKGGNRRADNLIQDFRETVDLCNHSDCGFSGYQFTWSNNQGNGLIEERIDRFFANPAWLQYFNNDECFHIESLSSDHIPVIINCHGVRTMVKRKRQFRFEAMWLRDPGCEEVIRREWGRTGEEGYGAKVTESIVACGTGLEVWNRNSFGLVYKELNFLKNKIKWLGIRKNIGNNRDLLKDAKARSHELEKREEIMWRQRSRALWLKEGGQE